MRPLKMRYHHIVWDWNGTLLDDAALCREILNILLARRDLAEITAEDYVMHFGFPVKDYYVRLGFDFEKESFDNISAEYISMYNTRRAECSLHNGARYVLERIADSETSQSILSAYRGDMLKDAVEQFDLTGFFTDLAGLSDYYADSKVQAGKDMVLRLGIRPENILLIGDTIHDHQVAGQIGVDCILFAGGHQHPDRLRSLNCPVFENICDIIGLIEKL